MNFHVLPVPVPKDNPELLREFWNHSLCGAFVAEEPNVQIGDIVRFECEDTSRPDNTRFRQIVGQSGITGRPFVLFSPLNLPLMRQVEVQCEELETPRVYWVASRKPLKSGDTFQLERYSFVWTVLRAFVSVPVHAVPLCSKLGAVRGELSAD